MTKPLRILASDAGRSAVEQGVAELLGDRAYQFVSVHEVQAQQMGCEAAFDVAFVSRDVTGRSTKHEHEPHTAQFYRALLNSQELRWVHVHSAGVDRPVYQQLLARGVSVTGSNGTNAAVVAQSILSGLLSLHRRLPLLMQAQRQHQWQPLHGRLMPPDLQGQRLTLVGWGAIAQQFAPYAQMLGLKITVLRHRAEPISAEIPALTYAEVESVLPQTGWLVLACPLSVHTRGLLGAKQLALLPQSANLINVSRGEVVDESALIDALRQERLAGAYLDVFAHEPLPTDSALWELPNVIATPHCAGFSQGNEQRVAQRFIDNLRDWLKAEV